MVPEMPARLEGSSSVFKHASPSLVNDDDASRLRADSVRDELFCLLKRVECSNSRLDPTERYFRSDVHLAIRKVLAPRARPTHTLARTRCLPGSSHLKP